MRSLCVAHRTAPTDRAEIGRIRRLHAHVVSVDGVSQEESLRVPDVARIDRTQSSLRVARNSTRGNDRRLERIISVRLQVKQNQLVA